MAGTFQQNIPRPFTSPGRTDSLNISPAARFYGYNTEHLNEGEVGLTTTSNTSSTHQQPPAGVRRTPATEASSPVPLAELDLPRNLTVSALAPQLQSSPYIQYLYGTLNRGQGYSTTNSARTSYTRVDSMAMGDNPDSEADGGEALIFGAVDAPAEEQIQAIPQTPIVSICFLMISGKRRVMIFDPETTVGRVKELVWNTWPSGPDWQEERPSTPSHLRILHLGKVLQDEETLKACNFPIFTPTSSSSPVNATSPPTIVHLAIRPTGPDSLNLGDQGDLEKKKNRSARTRLVARFSSVLASTDGADEISSSPVQGTLTSAGTSSAGTSPTSRQRENNSHGCSCCIVC